ncbi:hypothetical protein HLH48_13715 [Gluconacetobacter sacchari]|uniref:Uncharacterized protein n=2 Tax=Gluconacetobacter sacchari TaxID=92759 RepID=A0A7W4NNT0_9PROT|nr:hypothetical protein [Gluconacetobacter sacchari]
MLDAAKAYGIAPEDPLWPIMAQWDSAVMTLAAQRDALEELGRRVGSEIKTSLDARTQYHKAEAAGLAAMAQQVQAETIRQIGEHVARAADEALTRRVRSFDRNTLAGSALAAVIIAASLFGIGHWRGYSSGFAIATTQGDARFDDSKRAHDAEIAALERNATDAARLFHDHPEEIAAWAPLIQLNRLAATSLPSNPLNICRYRTVFAFDQNPNQIGCWLPLRIPTQPDRPATMGIPGPVPSGAPSEMQYNENVQ